MISEQQSGGRAGGRIFLDRYLRSVAGEFQFEPVLFVQYLAAGVGQDQPAGAAIRKAVFDRGVVQMMRGLRFVETALADEQVRTLRPDGKFFGPP